MIYVYYGIPYLMYAFLQASLQLRLGHSFAEKGEQKNPTKDLFGFMLFAPLITLFYTLAIILVGPIRLFDKYAHAIAKKD